MNDWKLNWMMPAEPLGPAIKAAPPEPPKPAEPAHDWSCAQESDRPAVTIGGVAPGDTSLCDALPAAYINDLRRMNDEIRRNSIFANFGCQAMGAAGHQAEARRDAFVRQALAGDVLSAADKVAAYYRRQAELAAAAKRVDDLHQEDIELARRNGLPEHVWRAMTNEGRAALRKQWVPVIDAGKVSAADVNDWPSAWKIWSDRADAQSAVVTGPLAFKDAAQIVDNNTVIGVDPGSKQHGEKTAWCKAHREDGKTIIEGFGVVDD